jgi:hypothetical protein
MVGIPYDTFKKYVYDDEEKHRKVEPHTCTTFDKVVDGLEQALHHKTFKDESRCPRCKTLMKCLEAKFKTTKYKLSTVALETGMEQGSGPDAYERGKSVKVPVWDFQQVIDSFLLNPILFSNKDNLINGGHSIPKVHLQGSYPVQGVSGKLTLR